MKRYRQHPDSGRMNGSIGAGRDNVPTAANTRPVLSEVRNALAGTMFGLGAMLLGAPGAAATPPPIPRAEETTPTMTRSTSSKTTVACKKATQTLKSLVKKAHRTKIRFATGDASRAQLVKANRDVRQAQTKVNRVCATPVVPPAPVEDPAVVIARHSSPETAARTPQEALALVRAFPWTKQVTKDSWTDFERSALMTGVPASEEELAQTDEGFRGITVGMYSPFPNVLVRIVTDPRPAPLGGKSRYAYATEYSNGWAVGSMSYAPQFRTMPDSNHPKGYRYERFNEFLGKWEKADSTYWVINSWDD